MISDEATESVAENRISCKCKSTCLTKRTANTNRGCPCKGAGRICGSECSCGSTAKPCRNKPGGDTGRHPVSSNRRPQPYQIESRPSEEEERARENNDVKEFIQTLDEPMVRKLCIRSLRRGVGSMDFIQGLLIMEDDLDEGHEEDETDVTPTPCTSTDLACSSNAGTPDPAPSPSNNAIPWCKCGVCQIMPQEIENKCCGLQRCVTTHTRFSKLCLDPDVIQLAIRNRGDIRNDRDDNSTRAFRKTGYRQYVLRKGKQESVSFLCCHCYPEALSIPNWCLHGIQG